MIESLRATSDRYDELCESAPNSPEMKIATQRLFEEMRDELMRRGLPTTFFEPIPGITQHCNGFGVPIEDWISLFRGRLIREVLCSQEDDWFST